MANYLDNESNVDYINENSSSSLFFDTDDLGVPLLIKDNQDVPLVQTCLFEQKNLRHIDTNNIKARKQLILATILCVVFMIAELIGGYLAGSLAIMTDAAHLLSDSISFIVALIALSFAKKPSDHRMSFGYKRIEVLSAILSVLCIWLLTGILIYLATLRLLNTNFDIDANTMIIVSIIGVTINIIMGIILHGSCSLSHNHTHSHGHSHSHEPKKEKVECNSHNHSHSHNHNNNNINKYNESMHNNNNNNNYQKNTNSRHNSFGNGGGIRNNRTNSFSKVLNTMPKDGLNAQSRVSDIAVNGNIPNSILSRLSQPLIHRLSVDGGLTRISIDNRSLSFTRLSSDEQISTNTNYNQNHHRDSITSIISCESSNNDNNIINNINNNNSNIENNKQNINIRAAVIHVIGDFIQSIGVLIAAIIIKFHPSAKIADPICTFTFSIIVFFTTYHVIKDSILIILDAVPSNVSYTKLENELNGIQGVHSIHHLNVWNLTVDWNVMSVHIIIDAYANSEDILKTATSIAQKEFHIKHVTIQIERINTIKEMLLSSDISGTTTTDISDSIINLEPTIYNNIINV